MNETENCPRCGGRLKAGPGGVLCARCLLAAALRPPAATEADQPSAAGEQIGAYRIVRLLGEGGMGVVYLAEQEQPIARQVALKIIKLGMDTRAVLARFQSEQQALALMDHPNIAQVHEAGSSAEGRPYFVMEYVPGVPITEYCDRRRLNTRQRLELFVQVANAVQHAHQKGVIHRDLKPSNVLVMERDGEAVPKIIDFGLAKATEKHLTEETLFTEAGVLIGTPEYMSPEQASLGARNVDTRTDIYSLGVLLYELLVGVVPFDSKALRAAGYEEIRRIICEEDPPAPATRLLSLGARAAEIASCRSTDSGVLRKQVRGELEWISMKALEKDRARRYPSASEMVSDIQRHLRNEPVTAGPAGPGYRLRKFVRKNRLAVAAVAAIIILLAFGFGVVSVSYVQVRRERARALRESYAANVASSELLLRDNQPDQARKRLQACEPAMRDWEWWHLWHKSDSSLVRLRTEGDFRNWPFPSAIAFAGPRVCWNTQTTVECWDAPGYTGPAVFRFARVLGMSRDGVLAVTAGDDVKVVEVASGKSVSTCRDCKAGSYYAIFSPDRTRIAMSFENSTIVWEALSGRTLARVAAGGVLAFSPDGRQLAVRGTDLTVNLWSVDDPPHKVVSLDAGGYVHAAAFSPTGARLACAAGSGAVRVWNLKPLSGPKILATHGQRVHAVAFSPDGRRIAVTGYDQAIRIWLDDRLVTSLPAFGAPQPNAIAFSPDGTRLVAGAQLHELAVWDATTYGGQILPTMDQNVTAIASSGRARLVAAGLENGGVELHGVDGTVVRAWQAGPDAIRALTFTSDGNRLATGSASGGARIWDVASGAPVVELRGHSAAIQGVAFSPDGARLATGSKDRTARVWDAGSGRAITTIELKDPVNSVAFSADGAGLLVAAGDPSRLPAEEPSVRLWNAVTGAMLKEFRTSEPCMDPGSQCPALQASFSPSGDRVLAALSGKGVSWVWNTRNGAVIAKLQEDVMPASAVFSPSGSRIFTASYRGPLRIWGSDPYETILVLSPDDHVDSLTFSPDGSVLFGVTEEGHVRTWKTDTAHPPTYIGTRTITRRFSLP